MSSYSRHFCSSSGHLVQAFQNNLEEAPVPDSVDTLEEFQEAFNAYSDLWFRTIRIIFHNHDKYRDHAGLLFDQATELGELSEVTEAEYRKLEAI